ncbi:hypothetical protein A9974_27210 [Achromobacter sp. UMC71]|nr:hypothetical protein [Achromobacter sp. UMC71]
MIHGRAPPVPLPWRKENVIACVVWLVIDTPTVCAWQRKGAAWAATEKQIPDKAKAVLRSIAAERN